MNRVRWDGSTADEWRRHDDFESTVYGWQGHVEVWIDGDFDRSMANGIDRDGWGGSRQMGWTDVG